jgi:hypothetical protein
MNYIQEMNITTPTNYYIPVKGNANALVLYWVLNYILAIWFGWQLIDHIGEFVEMIWPPPQPAQEQVKESPRRQCIRKAVTAVDGAPAICPANQHILDFLYCALNKTSNTFKRAAYMRAIIDIAEYPAEIDLDRPGVVTRLTPGMERRVQEYLEGFPEDDIIYS